ncbi:MAG: hypothetical protein CVV44_20625 [Spirochaetae bacterium HGW-Spirochaetae-1]|jgi:Flp pilus assembly protein TadD|nr:MAG: hypothetical protein CVV44_20625 [Spirochaetae bacterium HGW-Spirochaetae-1]
MKKAVIILMFTLIHFPLLAGIHDDVDELIRKRDFQAAEKMAQQAVDKNPLDLQALCALGCVYRNMAYKEGIQFDSTAAGIRDGESGMGEFNQENFNKIFTPVPYYEKEIFKKAETIYFKIIEIDKTYSNAYFNLLNSYAVMRNFEKYFSVIDLYLVNFKEDNNTPYILNDLAGKLYKDNSYDEAVRLFKICIDRYPSYAPAVCDLGAVYFQQGDISGAYRQFKAAYKIDGKDAINLANLARSCIYLEEFKEAYEYYGIITQTVTDDIFNDYTTGILGYMSGGEYASLFTRFIENRKKGIQDHDKDFWIFTAGKFLELEKFEAKEKNDFFEYLLDSFRKNEYDTYSIMTANILLKQGSNSFALVVNASIFDRLRFTEKTIYYLEKIEDRKKDDPGIMSDDDLNFNYGRNYLYSGKIEKSLSCFNRITPESEHEAAVNYYMGRIYLIRKDNEKARTYLMKNRDREDKKDMYYINESIRILRTMESEKPQGGNEIKNEVNKEDRKKEK